MTITNSIIALADVGNTSTKISLWNPRSTLERLPVETLSSDAFALFDACTSPINWYVISVNRQNLQSLEAMIFKHRPEDQIKIIRNHQVPIKNLTDSPSMVGTDRLLAAYAVSTMFPDSTSIVIDAGTAITIDVINERAEFLGGCIVPGIQLMFDSLQHGTDQLPLLMQQEWTQAPSPIGSNTELAIESGVYHATWGAIKLVVERLLDQHANAVVVYTGPSLGCFGSEIPESWVAKNTLVFQGLARLASQLADQS